MKLGDTIVAQASAPGRSARTLIRISGPATGRILSAMAMGIGEGRGVSVVRWRLGEAACPALASRFVGQRSYTGEDSAEVQVAGHPALARRVIDSIIAAGARHAEPGEFSARAYLNGRISLEQAEGVAATIAAQTEGQLAAARAIMAGETGDKHRRWMDRLARLLALVEAGIDFTDQEDVVAIEAPTLRRELGELAAEIRMHLGGAPIEAREGQPRVVLAGPPNAGKSTLFNALLGRTRAVVSPVAGTTRDALVETLDLSRDAAGAGEVDLVDLAGLEDADGVIGRAAQAAAHREIAGAAVVVHCDASGTFLPIETAAKVIRVRTKADRGASARAGLDTNRLDVCALDGWNLERLRVLIAEAAWGSLDEVLVVVPRHRRSLLDCAAALDDAATAAIGVRGLRDPEVVADRLRAALDALGEITGRMSPDEVLGRIFATFCVGK